MRIKAEQLFMKIILVAVMLFSSIPVIAADRIQVRIPVSCTAEAISDQFTYTITPLDNAPLPEMSSISLKDGETGEFVIPYTDPNTWHYEVKQNNEASQHQDIKYDTTIYKAIVFIGVKEDGTLYSEVSIIKEGSADKSAGCVFHNISGSKTADSTTSKPDSKTDAKSKTDSEQKSDKNKNSSSDNRQTKTTSNKEESSVKPSENVNTPNVQTGDRNKPLFYLFVMIGVFVIAGGHKLFYKRG